MTVAIKPISYEVLHDAFEEEKVIEIVSLNCLHDISCIEVAITEPCILYFEVTERGSVYQAKELIAKKGEEKNKE